MKEKCEKCGHPLSGSEKFCTKCGQPVNTKNEKQNMAAGSKKEPAKENATVNSHEGNVKLKDGGFISMLLNEVKDLLKHPKKLLPTIILSAVWMLFSLLSTFGANIPILRFLYIIAEGVYHHTKCVFLSAG